MSENFNPNEHLLKLKRSVRDGDDWKTVEDDYLEVKWRLCWFRDKYPQGSIETEEVYVDLDREITAERYRWVNRKKEFYTVTGKGYARYRAMVCTGEGGRATGTKTESAVDFPDFVEKAETGAIGRALAALGFGTQFTGDEFNEAHRIVDTPVRHDDKPEEEQKVPETDLPASEQQVSSIRKLSGYLHKPVPDGLDKLTFFNARKVIQQLTTEYKEARQKQAS
jgi:hypothetical protein